MEYIYGKVKFIIGVEAEVNIVSFFNPNYSKLVNDPLKMVKFFFYFDNIDSVFF